MGLGVLQRWVAAKGRSSRRRTSPYPVAIRSMCFGKGSLVLRGRLFFAADRLLWIEHPAQAET